MTPSIVIWILGIVCSVSVVANLVCWRYIDRLAEIAGENISKYREEHSRNYELLRQREKDKEANESWQKEVERLIGDPAYYQAEVDKAAARIERLYQANRRKRLEAEAKAEAERRHKLEQERQKAEHERRMKEDPAYAAEVRRAAEAKQAAESASYIFAGDGGGYSGDGGCSDGGGGDGGGGCGD